MCVFERLNIYASMGLNTAACTVETPPSEQIETAFNGVAVQFALLPTHFKEEPNREPDHRQKRPYSQTLTLTEYSQSDGGSI